MIAASVYAEKALTQWARLSIPQSGVTLMIATGASWYGRRVALTYAPGWLADYCIQSTIRSMGNVAIGRVIGATVVAPAIAPSLTPYVVLATTIAFWYATVLICNLFHQAILFLNNKRKPSSTASFSV